MAYFCSASSVVVGEVIAGAVPVRSTLPVLLHMLAPLNRTTEGGEGGEDLPRLWDLMVGSPNKADMFHQECHSSRVPRRLMGGKGMEVYHSHHRCSTETLYGMRRWGLLLSHMDSLSVSDTVVALHFWR